MTKPIDISAAAAALGRKGGQSTSERKAAASRANGKRGGRPRKQRGYDMTNSGFKTIKVGDIVIYKGHRLPQYNGCEARVTAIDHKLNQATLALPDKHVALVTSDQIEK